MVIEQVICALSERAAGLTEKQKRRYLTFFARAALRIIRIEGFLSETNPVDALFAPSLQPWQKEKIGALLLRLFAVGQPGN